MTALERARLIPVSGTNDTPDLPAAIDVQFNPVTLKVNLANTLNSNNKNSSTRAIQFVDKSSSTLTVELVFDTTYIESPSGQAAGSNTAGNGNGNGNGIEQGSDVRRLTRRIADLFVKPVEASGKMQAPSRMLFQWGAFEFIGLVSSYDETLDFFSSRGRPLRATVALKLAEDNYQFRSNDNTNRNLAQSPTLAFTGNQGDNRGGGADQGISPVPGGSSGPGNWRSNALFNGIESPRLPSTSALALPSAGINPGSIGAGNGSSLGQHLPGAFGATGGPSFSLPTSTPTAIRPNQGVGFD